MAKSEKHEGLDGEHKESRSVGVGLEKGLRGKGKKAGARGSSRVMKNKGAERGSYR